MMNILGSVVDEMMMKTKNLSRKRRANRNQRSVKISLHNLPVDDCKGRNRFDGLYSLDIDRFFRLVDDE